MYITWRGVVAMRGEIVFDTHTHSMFYQTKQYKPEIKPEGLRFQ